MRNIVIIFLLCCTSLLSTACTYGVYKDKRLVDTVFSDERICTTIRRGFNHAHIPDQASISIYSYYGKVFLVGPAPGTDVQKKIVEIARATKDVRSVTTHWFPPAKGESNLLVASKLKTNMLSADGLVSSRVDTEISAGRVVLLGVVKSEQEKQIAIRTAKQTSGVKSVTSYLMLPQ